MRAKLISGTEKWGFSLPKVQLGRSSKCDIHVSDPSASRIHVQLHIDRLARYMLVDCGSRNGTLLNDQLVLGPTLLNNKDVIRIGQQEFIFEGNTDFQESPSGRIGGVVPPPEKFPMILLSVRLREDAVTLVRETPAYSSAFGQWFTGQEKLITKHDGIFDSVDQRSFIAYWATEEKIVRESMKQVLSYVTDSRKITAHLSEELRQAIAGPHAQSLLSEGVGIHYGMAEGRKMETPDGDYYLMTGEDLDLVSDLSSKAAQSGDLTLCDEKTQSLLPDLSLATPFIMGMVGARKQAMLLHKLRV